MKGTCPTACATMHAQNLNVNIVNGIILFQKLIRTKKKDTICYTLINIYIYIGLGRHDYFFLTDATEQHPGWVM